MWEGCPGLDVYPELHSNSTEQVLLNYELRTGEKCPAHVSHLPNAETLFTSVLEKHNYYPHHGCNGQTIIDRWCMQFSNRVLLEEWKT